MKNTKRILILSVAIGAGHLKAGEGLCQAYREHFNGDAYHLDFMRYALPGLSGLIENSYYYSTKYFPLVYKWLYHLEDRKHSLLRSCESRIAVRKYRELINSYKPDAIISTHPFPAVVVSEQFFRFPIPNAVVMTDYTSHHLWVNPNTQLYFVAHEGMAAQLKEEGVNASQIKVTGIPVRLEFTATFSRGGLRRKMGLEPDCLTLMLMGGGNGIGPLMEALKILAESRDKMQLIVIAGHNREIYQKLRIIFNSLNLSGLVLPFVDNIQEYMAVSDLLISKAGGLTVTESLVMGLPMVIIRPTPGQEDGNTRFIENCGAGIYLKKIGDLGMTIDALLNRSAQLEQMRLNALRVARPDASAAVLTELEQLIQQRVVA